MTRTAIAERNKHRSVFVLSPIVAADARRKILLDYSRNHGRRADRNI